ncbi:MAG: tRNA-intron lyase [Methanosarcinales archaeon]
MAEKIWEGELIENRVIIWNPEAVALYDESGYGKPQPENNPNRLELDLIEAAYLLEKNKIKVFIKKDKKKKKINFQKLMEIGTKNVNMFHPSFIVFRDLRERGYLVKTGYKFGAVFRCYERGVKLKRGPKAAHEHTKWVVQPVAEESAFSLPEMSRAVRLAHNIRATFVWAVIDKESDVTYYVIQRITP